MMIRFLPALFFLSVCFSASAGEIPANSWVAIGAKKKPPVRFCSTWYMHATDEFMIWGTENKHRHEGKVYEVQTLDLKDEKPRWKESFPIGKEKTWAGGKFPNWGCGCHRLKHKPDRPWLTNVRDRCLGNAGAINRIRFVEADGVKRPTRGYTHHQGAYDTKRDRLVYFMGGKTFAYDPKKREWTSLSAKPPTGCDGLAWASMAYDPEGDRIMLFGGAYALNPWGGAKTWLFNCEKNEWSKAKCAGDLEPPLRCCSQLVYDAKNKCMVLFGGHALDRFLADTWKLDLASMTWKDMKPEASPPPVDRCAACFLPEDGKVFLVTASVRYSSKRHPLGAAWTYDAATNKWTPLPGDLPKVNMNWVSCDYSPKKKTVVLNSPGAGTWLYRPDLKNATPPKRKTVPAGTVKLHPWGSKQLTSFKKAPKPDPKAHEAVLKALPANHVIDSKYPGYITSKTWSTAIIDTDRGVVIYTGGGHSGYTGNDIALYDVGTNRWGMDHPPCFFPYFSNYNASLYGWGYYMRATSQHTYRWYAYDPKSKLMIYCARYKGPENGFTVQLEEDPASVFTYDAKKHKQWTFIYDPVKNVNYPPAFGRPFGNSWAMALCGTPEGVFAKAGGSLFLAKVTRDDEKKKVDLKWELLEKGAPSGAGEFQPLIHDSKRKRLLFVAAQKGKEVRVWEHPIGKGAWKEIKLEKSTPHISREIAYDVENDCLVSMPTQKLMVLHLGAEKKEWKELDVAMPKGRYGTESAMVYDPVHKVCVMLIPKGFSGYMQTMLFRYDPKTAKYK